MAEQCFENSSPGDLEKAMSEEIQSLKEEIVKLKLLLEKCKFCSASGKEHSTVVSAEEPVKSCDEKSELHTEVDVKSVQTCLCHCSSNLSFVSCEAETQTYETDFLGTDSYGCPEDWKPPEGSNITIADLVKEVVEQKSEQLDYVHTEQKPVESDYVYLENCNMLYSPSTGYYFDQERNLLYDPQSGKYFQYVSESGTYEFHSQVEVLDQLQNTSSEAMDADSVSNVTGYTEENGTSVTKQDDKEKQETKRKVPKSRPPDNNNVDGSAELNKAYRSSGLAVGTEKDDESSLEEGEVGSPYTESTTTEGSYYLSSVGSPASVNFDDDSAESWPPCIRLIVEESSKLKIGSLLLITCTGAVVGRDKNCRLCIPDISVSKTHAETSYNNETCEYYITDLGSQNGTFVNGTRLSQSKEKSLPHVLKHGDYICFGFCKLLAHIHPGTETCDECEPGQVQAKYSEQSEKSEKSVSRIQTKEEREKERKRQLRQLKKKFGLQSMTYEQDSLSINPPSTNYHDRTKERQKTKGSDNPYEKTAEPVSLNVTIPSDNKGYQLLKKMGWKEGEALGAKTTGETEPVPINVRRNRAGLGSASANSPEIPVNPRNRKWCKAQRRYYEATKESSSFGSDPPKFVKTMHEA